jgi:hypothetical protein
MGKPVDRVHSSCGLVAWPGPWWTTSARGQRARWRLAGTWRVNSRVCRCSPTVAEDDEQDKAVPEGRSPDHEWR